MELQALEDRGRVPDRPEGSSDQSLGRERPQNPRPPPRRHDHNHTPLAGHGACSAALAPTRDLLTSSGPSSDFLALSFGDGRIKVRDAVQGHLQIEFADIPEVEVGTLYETKRGHLALHYTCMKWIKLSSKKKRKAGSSLLVLGTGSRDVLALDVAVGQWRWRISDCHPGYGWCLVNVFSSCEGKLCKPH